MVISSNERIMNKDAPADVRGKDVRTKIIEAAQERLWHFGFKKTTIDEIAADAGIGKGTIYLHFSSKEEIALEIMAQFKQQSIQEVRRIAVSTDLTVIERLKAMLVHPILMSHERCNQSPAAIELVVAIRPSIQAHFKPFLLQEIEILAQLLEEGNAQGLFAVNDTKATAHTIKTMCSGFLPPFPCVTGKSEITDAISALVDLVYHGMRRCDKPVNENHE